MSAQYLGQAALPIFWAGPTQLGKPDKGRGCPMKKMFYGTTSFLSFNKPCKAKRPPGYVEQSQPT